MEMSNWSPSTMIPAEVRGPGGGSGGTGEAVASGLTAPVPEASIPVRPASVVAGVVAAVVAVSVPAAPVTAAGGETAASSPPSTMAGSAVGMVVVVVVVDVVLVDEVVVDVVDSTSSGIDSAGMVPIGSTVCAFIADRSVNPATRMGKTKRIGARRSKRARRLSGIYSLIAFSLRNRFRPIPSCRGFRGRLESPSCGNRSTMWAGSRSTQWS